MLCLRMPVDVTSAFATVAAVRTHTTHLQRRVPRQVWHCCVQAPSLRPLTAPPRPSCNDDMAVVPRRHCGTLAAAARGRGCVSPRRTLISPAVGLPSQPRPALVTNVLTRGAFVQRGGPATTVSTRGTSRRVALSAATAAAPAPTTMPTTAMGPHPCPVRNHSPSSNSFPSPACRCRCIHLL